MKLSDGEKLILLALADQKAGRDELDLEFIRSAILNGHSWALTWQLSGIPNEDTDPTVADETADILGMWSFIERSVQALPEDEQKKIEEDAYPFSIRFEGFDGNNDDHHSVASFLINNMDRFGEFKERYLNSHTQSSLPNYRRMLTSYRAELEKLGYGSDLLSADSVLSIVKVR